MRKLILGMFVSLDGFVSGPNGETDWIFKSGDDATDDWIIENLREAGLLAMGSRTFREMAGYWPTAETPFAAPMNETPKVVFTKKGLGETPDASASIGSWENPIVASGDLAQEVARLKGQPGKYIRAMGGAGLAQSLAVAGLIDEFNLLLCSVALGRGLPVFAGLAKPLDLQLVNTKSFSGGAIALTYRPA